VVANTIRQEGARTRFIGSISAALHAHGATCISAPAGASERSGFATRTLHFSRTRCCRRRALTAARSYRLTCTLFRTMTFSRLLYAARVLPAARHALTLSACEPRLLHTTALAATRARGTLGRTQARAPHLFDRRQSRTPLLARCLARGRCGHLTTGHRGAAAGTSATGERRGPVAPAAGPKPRRENATPLTTLARARCQHTPTSYHHSTP